MDVYGNGILSVDDTNRALKNLGYNKKSLTQSKLKFFVDRSGGVDYSGLSGAIGEASWQSNSSGKNLSKSDKRFVNKLKKVATDLQASKRYKEAFQTNSNNELTESGIRKGLKQLQNDLSTNLNSREVSKMIVMLNDADDEKDTLEIKVWREFVQTRGMSLLETINNDEYADGEGGRLVRVSRMGLRTPRREQPHGPTHVFGDVLIFVFPTKSLKTITKIALHGIFLHTGLGRA